MARLSPRWTLVALFLGGALISGFTILQGIDPFDEGLMLQAARRTADGQWVYRDFLWSYGPGNVLLLGGSFKLFGTSLLWWRIVRVAIDAAVALVVFLVLRREVGVRWALVGWVAAACAMAQPTSANPFPAALLFGLLAVCVAGLAADPRRAAAVAGVFVGLAAFWRPDFAAYAALGAAVALLIRSRRSLPLFAGATAATTALLYLPYAIVAGPGELWESLVSRSLRDGSYWRLPFPLGYDGGLGGPHEWKDLLEFYVPLLLVIGIALVAVGLVRSLSPLLAGLTAFGGGCLLYLLSRTDEFHATPLLVVLALALPLVAARAGRRLVVVPAVVVLSLLTLYGVSNRASALVSPQSFSPLHVDVADGVEAFPSDAAALPRVVRMVRSLVPPGEPIYVAPARSDLVVINDPLLYVLSERPNAAGPDFGLLTSEVAQRRLVLALSRVRPRAIVRWRDPLSTQREPNRRGTPTGVRVLDEWIDANYRLRARFGVYDVLVPRG